jgi:hypothetical protein
MFFSSPTSTTEFPFESISDEPLDLIVTLLECEDIRERWTISGIPNTHVHIEVGEQKETSKIVNHQKNPKFYQSFKFK